MNIFKHAHGKQPSKPAKPPVLCTGHRVLQVLKVKLHTLVLKNNITGRDAQKENLL